MNNRCETCMYWERSYHYKSEATKPWGECLGLFEGGRILVEPTEIDLYPASFEIYTDFDFCCDNWSFADE